ncbi:MAG TPA: hypothetical protein VKP30_12935 [Polyangiaceae bacterium]|nr:hypothetical protein [Polyangiaceae bacterium]
MTSKTQKAIAALGSMRLPELQARYLDVIGSATRCPNRTYLIRKISEALTSKAGKAPSPSSTAPTPRAASERHNEDAIDRVDGPHGERADTHATDGNLSRELMAAEQNSDAVDEHARVRRPRMTVDELRARYLEVVGRPSSSSHERYLKWKIREAEKGRVRVGPIEQRHATGTAVDVKVLPLRIEAPTLTRIDSAWRTQGLRSRMEFFRRAVEHYLEVLGGTH